MGDLAMRPDGVTRPVREFAEHILRVFPEWTSALKYTDEGDGTGDCSFCLVPPVHPTHRLSVVTRGNSVEVRYDDAEPPGPAEKLFVHLDKQPMEVAEAVVGFVRDVMSGRVVVVRERLPRFGRWLRGDCVSMASFRTVDELERTRPGKVVALYSWGTTRQDRGNP